MSIARRPRVIGVHVGAAPQREPMGLCSSAPNYVT